MGAGAADCGCSTLDLQAARRIESLAMGLSSLPVGRSVRCLAAIAVVLWWGGLNCLAGCLLAPSEGAVDSHCSMSTEGDCCLSQAGGEDPNLPESIEPHSSSLQTLSCCSLEAYSAEAGRKVRAVNGAILMAAWSRAGFAVDDDPRVQSPGRWTRVPDRGGTRLRCCVFLI